MCVNAYGNIMERQKSCARQFTIAVKQKKGRKQWKYYVDESNYQWWENKEHKKIDNLVNDIYPLCFAAQFLPSFQLSDVLSLSSTT